MDARPSRLEVDLRGVDILSGRQKTLSVQNRYAGDVGDFMKFGLLRHLAAAATSGGAGMAVGLNWYLVPDEVHNADGRHIAYLHPTNSWHPSLEACDSDLMRRLAWVVAHGHSVEALEASGALPAGCRTHREMLDPASGPTGRQGWHTRALMALEGPEVVFADPDNGVRTAATRSKSHKYATVEELADYARRGQSLVVYHHADRSAGVETQAQRRLAELASGVGQRSVGTVIARRGSCRFFLVTASDGHHERLATSLDQFAARWFRHADLVR